MITYRSNRTYCCGVYLKSNYGIVLFAVCEGLLASIIWFDDVYVDKNCVFKNFMDKRKNKCVVCSSVSVHCMRQNHQKQMERIKSDSQKEKNANKLQHKNKENFSIKALLVSLLLCFVFTANAHFMRSCHFRPIFVISTWLVIMHLFCVTSAPFSGSSTSALRTQQLSTE